MQYEDTYAFTREQTMKLAEEENTDELIDTIIRKYKQLEENYDFIIVEGSDFVGGGVAFEFNANVSFAKNLGSPVLIVVSGEGKTTAQIINAIITTINNFQEQEVQVLAVVANKVAADQVDDVRELLRTQLDEKVIPAVILMDKSLKNPAMQEVHAVGGKLLFGENFAVYAGR